MDMDKPKVIKLSIAGALFLIAIVVFLVQMDVFGGGSPPVNPNATMDAIPPDQRAEEERRLQEQRELEKRRPPAGS